MYLVGVRPVLMFGSVRGVGEGFVAAFVLADVRFLARVRAQMSFEILQTGVRFRAALELQTHREEAILVLAPDRKSFISFNSTSLLR